MDTQFSMVFFGGIIAWLGVIVTRTVRVESTSLSSFELERRIEHHDSDALKLHARELLLPRVRALLALVDALLMVIFSMLMILSLGWLVGALTAVLLGTQIGTVGRISLIRANVQRLYDKYETQLLRLVERWKWLEWFRAATVSPAQSHVASREELKEIIGRARDILSPDEQRRVVANLSFDNKTVHDVMTPVSVIDAIKVSEMLGPLVLDELHKTGHSRFPVYEGDINHVVGVLYLHELVNLKNNGKIVRQAMDERVYYIHEEQSLEHALHAFLKTKHHLFVVVNNYRETVGLLSLEDVLEALIGKKIVDEFDRFDDLRAVAASNPRSNNASSNAKNV